MTKRVSEFSNDGPIGRLPPIKTLCKTLELYDGAAHLPPFARQAHAPRKIRQVDPSFRALSGRLVRRHKGSLSQDVKKDVLIEAWRKLLAAAPPGMLVRPRETDAQAGLAPPPGR
jgi:hypothetical protein